VALFYRIVQGGRKKALIAIARHLIVIAYHIIRAPVVYCDNGTWSFVPQLTQLIFTAGRLRSSVRLAEAQRDQALVAYERSIQTAFSDVSNALIAHQRTRETRIEQERLMMALKDRKRLAYVRDTKGA
jgi:hypothetical protein